jgi:hypothetical protein
MLTSEQGGTGFVEHGYGTLASYETAYCLPPYKGPVPFGIENIDCWTETGTDGVPRPCQIDLEVAPLTFDGTVPSQTIVLTPTMAQTELTVGAVGGDNTRRPIDRAEEFLRITAVDHVQETAPAGQP